MANNYDSQSGIQIGRVFGLGFGVILGNPATVLLIVLLFGAIPAVALSWLQQSMIGMAMDDYQRTGFFAMSFGFWVIGLALRAITQGALVRATVAHSQGETATFGESVGAGLSVALPLIGLTIVMAICFIFGLLLFIIPGIILFIMWAVAAPALVAERTGVFGALSRSSELTKGARWNVFGIYAILTILSWIIGGVIGFVAGLSGGYPTFDAIEMAESMEPGMYRFPFAWLLTNILISTASTAIWCTVQTALYVELRNWKDGPSEEALGDIFA